MLNLLHTCRAIESHRTMLIEEFEAANMQLNRTLSDVDRLRLQRQVDDLERQIQEIDVELGACIPENYLDRPPFSRIYGRDTEIKQLFDFLNGQSEGERSFVTICGIPGIGKTAVASHLFRLHSNSVWITRPTEQEDSKAYLTRAARQLSRGRVNSIMGTYDLLCAEDIWLFLDGIDAFIDREELKGFLHRLLPTDKGKIIITSSKPTNLQAEYEIELDPLSLNEAIALFADSWNRGLSTLSAEQLADVKTICGDNYLAGHPYSIQQIGLYARKRKLSDLSSILKRLRRTIRQPGNTAELTNMSTEIALKSLKKREQSLLCRIALLPGEFDESMIAYLSRVEPIIDWEEVFGELVASRLMEVTQRPDDSSVYRVHNVVRAIARREAQTLSEFKELQRRVGEMLIQSEQASEWVAGLLSLFQAEDWGKIFSTFREKYGECFLGEHLFAGNPAPDMLKVRACYAIAYTFDQMGNANLAVDYAQQGVDLLINVPSEDTAAYSAIQLRLDAVLARNLLALHKSQEGQVKISEAAEVVKNLPDDQYQALQWEVGQVHLLEGIYYHYKIGNDFEAEKASRLAAEIFTKIGDHGQYLRALSNLGTALEGQGRLRESADVNREILQFLVGEMNFPTLSPSVVESLTESETANLVDTLTKLGEFEEAQRHAYWGLPYCEEYGLEQSHAALLVNTGALEIELGEYDKAQESLEKALSLSRDLGYTAYEEQVYTYLAVVALKQENLERAQQNIERALKSEESYNQAEAYRVAGEICAARHDYGAAEQALLTSKQLSHENGYAYFEARASLELARLHQSANEFEGMETNLREAEGYFSKIDAPYYVNLIAGLRQQMR